MAQPAITSTARSRARLSVGSGLPWLLLLPLGALLGVAYLWPLGRMFLESLSEGGLDNYGRFFSAGLYGEVLFRTIRIAVQTAVICVLLAYPAAAYIARSRGRVRVLLLTLVFVPLWTSVIIRSYAWIVILQPDGLVDLGLEAVGFAPLEGRLLNREITVLLGMVTVLFPFAVIPIYAAFRGLDPGLRLAAGSLGASPLRQWTRVVLPLTSVAAISAMLLVFLVALGFYVTPAILGGPQNLMIGTLIDQQVRNFRLPFAAAISTMLLVATLAFLVLIRLMASASRRSAVPRP